MHMCSWYVVHGEICRLNMLIGYFCHFSPQSVLIDFVIYVFNLMAEELSKLGHGHLCGLPTICEKATQVQVSDIAEVPVF